jgi:riboflavin kinase/FMN adenylyltransferase
MRIHRGFHLPGTNGCALTIGNFDGVHRGHQAMLALLVSEARHRGVPSCALTFEPHPRDHFARQAGRPELAPPRIATLRDKLAELQRCGIDHVVVARFDDRLAAMPAPDFIARVLVGDDFSFGAKRSGNYALLDATGARLGFDVARMMSYEVHGLRVSSSAVRSALAAGDLGLVEALLGRPYSVSGHVLHGRKLGRELGFRTLNLRFAHARAATSGVFVVRVHGLADKPVPAVASFGVRPTVDDSGRVLLEVHCLDWPATLDPEAGYGRCLRVDLLHKLRDEVRYASLPALQEAIARDTEEARRWFTAHA